MLALTAVAVSCAHAPNAPAATHAHAAPPSECGKLCRAQGVVADVLLLRVYREADFTELSAIAIDPSGAPSWRWAHVERPGSTARSYASSNRTASRSDHVLAGNASVTGLVTDPVGNVWVVGWFREHWTLRRSPLLRRERPDASLRSCHRRVRACLARFGDGAYYGDRIDLDGQEVHRARSVQARLEERSLLTRLDDVGGASKPCT